MANTLALKSVEISFNQRTSQIEIVSKDRRLKNGAMKVAIDPRGGTSGAHHQLLDLLVAAGKTEREDTSYPSYPLKLSDEELVDSLRRNRPERTVIGLGRESREVAIDLTKNLLVAGGPGSGKSVMLRNVIYSALEGYDVALWAIDLKRVELKGYAFRPCDRLATTAEEALNLLGDLKRLMKERMDLLSAAPSAGKETPRFQPIYLLIEEIRLLIEGSNGSSKEDQLAAARALLMAEVLEDLAEMSRHVGIYLIVGTSTPEIISKDSRLRASLRNRILMGRSNPYEEYSALDAPSEFGDLQLRPRGRGVHSLYGVQQLFHSYFISHDAYSKSSKGLSSV